MTDNSQPCALILDKGALMISAPDDHNFLLNCVFFTVISIYNVVNIQKVHDKTCCRLLKCIRMHSLQLYEQALQNNEKLKSRLEDSRKELARIQARLERVNQVWLHFQLHIPNAHFNDFFSTMLHCGTLWTLFFHQI